MAYPNDMSRIASALAKIEASNGAQYTDAPRKAARNLIRRTYVLRKTAVDAMAADTTAYTAADQIVMPRACKVLAAYVMPTGTTAADNTDYATIKVQKGDGAAGSGTDIATGDTRAASLNALAAGVKETLTVTSTEADARIAAGGVLGFAIAKAGAGKVVSPFTITVVVEEEGLDSLET